MDGRTIDVGVITGSGLYSFPGEVREQRVDTGFGEGVVAVRRVGRWRVGAISRHGPGHRFLPHQVEYRANLKALARLGARAVLATTVVGAIDPALPLGRPVLFDDLFFPDNRLPDGGICTFFTEPGDPERGHLILDEPFSPRLRSRTAQAAKELGLEPTVGGVYGHTNGPRFETGSEIRALGAAGVTAVSLTCGPEAVLAGELELPYALLGFPVNYATKMGEPETKEDLERRLALSKGVLARLLLHTIETLEKEDLAFDYGYVYRMEGGV
ncbi:MAG: MTAP family purine nucleoside phosphorylase [Actinomycetota bacterium]|nr:MTAP family purine nucleoside phosphorylase [Actinomycetota bacterium]HZY65681.1 MTAP family purine nucleoside phosphorylase [Rubrobacteraceae bacterium]